MKVLGISFGRRNQRCDVLVKEALFAAKAAGAEVQFINTVRMDITHCHACDYCSRMCANGKREIHCCLKDDYHVLEEACLDADGIIIGAPVYVVGIVGQFKNFVDRFGPSHDRAVLLEENKKRIEEGKPELDPRYFKDRYTGYISVGGAQTHNWVSLGLPMLDLFSFSCCMKCVGHVDAYDQGRTGHPLFDTELMEKCTELGRTVAESVGRPYDEVNSWVGEEGVCPVCHNPLLSMNGTTHVECPICGIWGELSVNGDKVIVEWSEQEMARARNTIIGIYEHYNEIQNMIEVSGPKMDINKETLPKMMEKYKKFDETIANM